MRENIIALDPGEQTGYAVGYIEDQVGYLSHFGWEPWKTVSLQLLRAQQDPEGRKYDTLVYESWKLRRSSALQLVGSDMQSSQGIGCIKLAGWVSSAAIVMQNPADKSVINARMGGEDNWLPGGPVEHHRDAVRHFYYYCMVSRGFKVQVLS